MPNPIFDELIKLMGKGMNDKVYKQLSDLMGWPDLSTASTAASMPAESLSMDSIQEAIDLLRNIPEQPSINAIVITKLVPPGSYKVVTNEGEHILINVETWKDWKPQIEKVAINNVYASLSGIPIFDSDEYAARIIGKIISFDKDPRDVHNAFRYLGRYWGGV